MEKRLLFINHSREEIDEFCMAMPKGRFIIDTADNEMDAKSLMKQHTYGVVILDMYLKGCGGEKMIKDMNSIYPDTVCIVYTYTLTRGQLTFLLNHRNIFRIFLNPTDFLERMYPAIHEAFEVYELQRAEREEDERVERLVSEKTKSIGENSRILKNQQRGRRLLMLFLDRLLVQAMELTKKTSEKMELLDFEREILKKAGRVLEEPIYSLKEVEQRILEEFKEECEEMHFQVQEEEGKKELYYSYHALYIVLWFLLLQYWNLSRKNRAKIYAGTGEEGKLKAELLLWLPKEIWEREGIELRRKGEKRQLIEYAAEEILESYEKEIEGDEIRYRFQVKMLERE